MKLYNLTLTHGLLLAPMSGYTNWPMRILSRRFGAELCYTEMISADGLVQNSRNTLSLLDRPEDDSPLIAQIFTASPKNAALSARIIEDAGFDGIDINMGCPVRKVVQKGAGAALMRDAVLAEQLCESVVKAVRIPVSVKMRSGWDSSTVNAESLACILEKTGINAVIIHPRTRSEMYRGVPRWDIIGALRQRTALPVVASGNIRTSEDVGNLGTSGADAFMIGRAAVGNPWVFRELSGGPLPDLEERREVMLEHLDMLCTLYGENKGIRFMRKYISAYARGLSGAALFRQQTCAASSYRQLEGVIKGFVRPSGSC